MIAWLLLPALIVAEIVALRWWLNREYFPVIFNGWAVLLYTAVIAVDFIIAWLVSMLFEPGGSASLQIFAFIGVGAILVVFAFTLFFRWVLWQDLPGMDTGDQNKER